MGGRVLGTWHKAIRPGGGVGERTVALSETADGLLLGTFILVVADLLDHRLEDRDERFRHAVILNIKTVVRNGSGSIEAEDEVGGVEIA